MLRKLFVVSLLLFLSLASTQVSATSIDRNPVKRKGAGALFQIRREKLWGYMDRTGKVVIEPQFRYERDFFNGLASVLKNDKFGYINEKGEEVIPFKFDGALDFIGEIAPVRVGRKWGYIDLKGEWVLRPQFQAAGELIDGLARVVQWTRVECGNSKVYRNATAPPYVFGDHKSA